MLVKLSGDPGAGREGKVEGGKFLSLTRRQRSGRELAWNNYTILSLYLPWLPITFRIKHNILNMACKALVWEGACLPLALPSPPADPGLCILSAQTSPPIPSVLADFYPLIRLGLTCLFLGLACPDHTHQVRPLCVPPHP